MPDWPKLPDPGIAVDATGSPVSNRFGDIYFSPGDGIAESTEIFLNGIGAPDCWVDRNVYTIGETGFGTGLNFLLTWKRWRETAAPSARLNYVSVEGFPLDLGQMADALAAFPSLAVRAKRLAEQYPIRHGGFHRLAFDGGRVSLTLLFGEVETMLNRLTARIDAWYLDGFAPAKDPAMWTEPVFRRIAALSAPGARLTTFTSSGYIRQGLRAAGFEVEEVPGFGRKKERLIGRLARRPSPPPPGWTDLPAPLPPGSRVAVIGSGIAGSSTAGALRSRGCDVTVFDATGAPGGAIAGNPAVVLSPKPPIEADFAGRINALAFLDSLRRYNCLERNGVGVWRGIRGVTALSNSSVDSDRRARALAAIGWPDAIAHMTNDPALSPHAVACFPDSGCIDPVAACRAFNGPVIPARIDAIEKIDAGWMLGENTKFVWEGDAVVVAAGAFSIRALGLEHTPLHPNRGQVSLIDAAALDGVPETALGFDGYLSAPIERDGQTIRVLGSSFAGWRDVTDPRWQDPSEADHQICLNGLREALASPPANGIAPLATWAGLRASPPDWVPLMGAAPDENAFLDAYAGFRHGKIPRVSPPHQPGLFMLAGLGARGYQLGPLLGETLADLISGDPPPLERDLIDAMNPARYLARKLKQNAI